MKTFKTTSPAGRLRSWPEKPRSCFDVVVPESSDAKCHGSFDVVSFSDLDSLFSDSSSDTKGEAETASFANVSGLLSRWQGRRRQGRWPFSRMLVSHLLDACTKITCNRFQVLLRHLYTDEFEPWGSTERRGARAFETISESYGIPKPSPKSVHRPADEVTNPRVPAANLD